MDQPTETPKKSPGAPKGNTNALKHGFYSRAFRKAEETDLSTLDLSSLEHEIGLLRVFIRRTAEQNKETTPEQSLVLLSVLSRAALSVGSLIRTQRTALVVQKQNDIDEIIARANAEFTRARELINRTKAYLADLEAAQADEEDEEEEDDEDDGEENDENEKDEVDEEDEAETASPPEEIKYSLDADSEICDVPTACVPCPDHLTCPDCPAELREFLKKHPAAALIDPNCSSNSICPSRPRRGVPQGRRGAALRPPTPMAGVAPP